mmetsp:Transcript_75913/g.203373  ORF Transcript_75913/g.203373 Transcript_75913/m.203373 type:complete len:533 (-) Transcript_75913:337-1935(-)
MNRLCKIQCKNAIGNRRLIHFCISFTHSTLSFSQVRFKGSPVGGEQAMSQYMPFHCSLGQSLIDFVMLSPDGARVLCAMEFKLIPDNMDGDVKSAIQQLVSYMLNALSVGQWGTLNDQSPLQGLVVFTSAVYKVTLLRPADAARHPFGLEMTVERATEHAAMEEMIRQHVRAASDKLTSFDGSDPPNCDRPLKPHEWAATNLDIDESSDESLEDQMRKEGNANFGFLFRTRVGRLRSLLRDAEEAYICSELPDFLREYKDETRVVVKYLSSLLDLEYKSKYIALRILLSEIESFKAQIKHPYIGIVLVEHVHPLLVMEDMGHSLSCILKTVWFRDEWRSRSLAMAFYQDVCLTALNLTCCVRRCHGDIRAPNIVYRGESFCLVDFDMVMEPSTLEERGTISNRDLNPSSVKLARFSVLQIAVVVFELDRRSEKVSSRKAVLKDVEKVTELLFTNSLSIQNSSLPKDFREWAEARKVLDIFDPRPAHKPQWTLSELTRRVRAMLQIQHSPPPRQSSEPSAASREGHGATETEE